MNSTDTRLVMVDQDQVELDGADTSNDEQEILSPFDPSKIRVETKNTQMDALIKRIKNNEINLAPDFQRQPGVWNLRTQSRLIESMLIRIPLPAFYMDATDDNNWLVVDGLQRLTTIRKYVVDKDMALEGLEFLVDYNGKKYDQLPRTLQRRIEETDIVIYQIQPGTPNRVKFDIFRRINTGGAPLSPQEIRHALNQGPVTKMLQQLAETKGFKKATGNGISPKRMDDRECVLRFLAFTINAPDKYISDNFDQFLNDAMETLNSIGPKKLQKLYDRFIGTMELAYALFGNDAFRKRYVAHSARFPINKALFEAWSVNLGSLNDDEAKHLILSRKKLKEKFLFTMQDGEFEKAITQGTGSVKRVRLRFKEINRIILEVLQC